ncbi:MAG: hypothetical protein ACKOEC_11205 [Acidimicrobiia bacterium]
MVRSRRRHRRLRQQVRTACNEEYGKARVASWRAYYNSTRVAWRSAP